MCKASWHERAAAKVADTASKIPPHWRLTPNDLQRARETKDLTGPFIESFLSSEEISITRLASDALVSKIASRSLTSLEVATAYCKTAAIAHQINNCLHEIFFDKALERAAELDAYLENHGTTLGPLHGLPVSLKDQFHVKGIDTTMGYVGWINTYQGISSSDKIHKTESQVVTDLLSQGAILYCKTSLPQTLMYGETINNIIGQTLNPLNQRLSCGGSSGGEAALQALHGSSVGLGTDIGGSVRIPAAFCGTYSLKPTPKRLPYGNIADTNPGQRSYPATVGVMGTSLAALKLVAKGLLDTEPWLRDPDVVPIPWRTDIETETLARADEKGRAIPDARPLKIGILYNDGYMTPHPPITRGLHIVSRALESAGHKVVPWDPPSHKAAADIHLAFLVSDGGHDVHKQLALSGEALIEPLRNVFEFKDPISAIEIQDLSIAGRNACAAYYDYWNSRSADDGQDVDAFVMPVAPHAAVIPGCYLYTGYTEVVNLLDYSACVVPVTRADKEVDVLDEGFQPLNEMDKKNWELYDKEKYDGAPVGLQIVCRKWEEEKIWAVGKIVDAVLREYERREGSIA
ncbi:general amidase [Sporormia fimetaria CBS 119925]|uniref:General amidase n=1 Tax=Sporormia fimetaria CBS 119925 TaxID=1340428 RepID=A0A6A6VHX3_9PLEO|nr:general amidase [Sporormia fimetaria CBS 119925]